MSDQTFPSRRFVMSGAIAGAAGLFGLTGRPVFAQEQTSEAAESLSDKGYALGDVVKGDPDAPVTIIEYASLTCPHCGSFHTDSLPEIEADYIETGKAKLIVREIYFDQFGLWSSMIARCGGPESYHKLIGMFLARQEDWYFKHRRAFNETKNAKPIVADMKRIGRLAGLSNARMDACLSDKAYLERLVQDFQTTSTEDDVQSTPTFFVNGDEVVGAVSADAMAAEIEKHL